MNLELNCGAKIEASGGPSILTIRVDVTDGSSMTGVIWAGSREVSLKSVKILIEADDLEDIANFFDELVKEHRLEGDDDDS